jgi:hypothetical protein
MMSLSNLSENFSGSTKGALRHQNGRQGSYKLEKNAQTLCAAKLTGRRALDDQEPYFNKGSRTQE